LNINILISLSFGPSIMLAGVGNTHIFKNLSKISCPSYYYRTGDDNRPDITILKWLWQVIAGSALQWLPLSRPFVVMAIYLWRSKSN